MSTPILMKTPVIAGYRLTSQSVLIQALESGSLYLGHGSSLTHHVIHAPILWLKWTEGTMHESGDMRRGVVVFHCWVARKR